MTAVFRPGTEKAKFRSLYMNQRIIKVDTAETTALIFGA